MWFIENRCSNAAIEDALVYAKKVVPQIIATSDQIEESILQAIAYLKLEDSKP
jgi:hypothetical protein